MYTTRVSDTRIRLTIKITNNPGIANYSIAVKSDPAFKAKQHTQEDPRYSAPEDALISNYYYNEENHQSFLICVMGKTSSGISRQCCRHVQKQPLCYDTIRERVSRTEK